MKMKLQMLYDIITLQINIPKLNYKETKLR